MCTHKRWITCTSLSSVSGEIVVNEVNFVRKCIATDTSQYDLWGKLVCTNFKISFITDDPMPLQVGYCSYGYIMNVISGIIHTFSVNNKLMPSKQAVDEVPLSCSECVAVPSIHIRTRARNLYRSTSSSTHLHVWRLPQEVVLQRQSRNYTQMCPSLKELFANVPWARQGSDLHVVEFYWCY